MKAGQWGRSGGAVRTGGAGLLVGLALWFGLAWYGASQPQTAAARVELAKIGPENANHLQQVGELAFGEWSLATDLAWSPDGRWLAVGAGDAIHLLDLQTWAPGAPLKPAYSYSTGAFSHGLAFSPDGAWLAAGSRDGLLRVWVMPPVGEAFEPELQIQAHRKGVNAVTFSPDGLRLASGGNDAVARFWDRGNGKMLGLMVGGTFAVPSIDFTPDGTLLAVVNGPLVRLREVGTERITGTFRWDAPLYRAIFSPDGNLLAASDQDNRVLLWDPATAYRTGREQYPEPQVLAGHRGRSGGYRALVWDLAFSPDSRLLASAGGDGQTLVWDVASGRLLAALAAHPRGAAAAGFNPGGLLLATAGLDGRVRLWGVVP